MEGRRLIIEGLATIKSNIRLENFKAARETLGRILHVLQVRACVTAAGPKAQANLKAAWQPAACGLSLVSPHCRTSTATVTGWSWATWSPSGTSSGQICPWKTWQVRVAAYKVQRTCLWVGLNSHEVYEPYFNKLGKTPPVACVWTKGSKCASTLWPRVCVCSVLGVLYSKCIPLTFCCCRYRHSHLPRL